MSNQLTKTFRKPNLPMSGKGKGFTIIEVLIVLGITGVLFIVGVLMVAGQQQKTEFGQAIHDAQSQIIDVIDNVSTGFYPNFNNFNCSANGSGPVFATQSGSNTQGANKDCIFIGKVMQFGLRNNQGFNIYTVAGQRLSSSGNQVTSIAEAIPVAVAPGTLQTDINNPSDFDSNNLLYGLTAAKMYINDANNTKIGAVGFFSTFANYNGGNLVSGTPTVNLIPIGNGSTDLTTSAPAMVDKINDATNLSNINPPGGVTICFASGGTNQYGAITIGVSNRQLTTNLTIGSGSCP